MLHSHTKPPDIRVQPTPPAVVNKSDLSRTLHHALTVRLVICCCQMAYRTKIDPADSVFSQWIRLRDKECLRCHSPVQLNEKGLPVSHQASHFQGRRKESTRFDPENVCTLCGGCHMYFTANPAEHYAWQVERLGQTVVDRLVLRSNFTQKKDRKLARLFYREKIKKDFGIQI